jgi:hypothetical protein
MGDSGYSNRFLIGQFSAPYPLTKTMPPSARRKCSRDLSPDPGLPNSPSYPDKCGEKTPPRAREFMPFLRRVPAIYTKYGPTYLQYQRRGLCPHSAAHSGNS